MTRKKIKIADKDVVDLPEGEEERVSESAEEETKSEPSPKPLDILEVNFTVSDWKGHPNYGCNHCVWSGLEKVRAQAHFIDKHALPPKSVAVGVKLYDRYGNLITEREE